jgi:predicted membrane chloride channel (bestrophin family)
MEGRRAWTTLAMVSQNFARNIWINAVEREDHEKDDLLAKMLVFSFSMAFNKRLTQTIEQL